MVPPLVGTPTSMQLQTADVQHSDGNHTRPGSSLDGDAGRCPSGSSPTPNCSSSVFPGVARTEFLPSMAGRRRRRGPGMPVGDVHSAHSRRGVVDVVCPRASRKPPAPADTWSDVEGAAQTPDGGPDVWATTIRLSASLSSFSARTTHLWTAVSLDPLARPLAMA